MAKLVECITRDHSFEIKEPFRLNGPIFSPKRKKMKGYQRKNKKYRSLK